MPTAIWQEGDFFFLWLQWHKNHNIGLMFFEQNIISYFVVFVFGVKCYPDVILTGLVRFTVLSITWWHIKCCTDIIYNIWLYYNLCTIVRLVNVIHTPTPTETSVLLCIWLTGMITAKHKSLGRKRGGKLVCFSQWNVNNVDETGVTSQWRTQAKYFRCLFLLPSLDL